MGTIGDYELLSEIARGGMGVVYRARQISLDRIVALKLILESSLATDEAKARFRIEAESAAGIDHPNLVPIYEIGEEDNHLFYSMKLTEGGTLQSLPESWKGDYRHIARAIAKVSRALQAVHDAGVLHRDLKPGNVLLDSDGEPHLADFGLARRMDADSMLTMSGQVLGTPGYMSPEQASGDKLTTASDVYSVGAVLYHLLTGRIPFQAGNIIETLRMVTEELPERPTQTNARIPRDLETIVMKCLEKSPAHRYRSAAALAEDLDRWASGETISARPSSKLERAVKWSRRNPALTAFWAAAALLTVTLMIGGPLAALMIKSESDQRREQLYIAQMNQISEAFSHPSGQRLAAPLVENWAGDEAASLRGWEWGYFRRQTAVEERGTVVRKDTNTNAFAAAANGALLLDRVPDSKWRFQLFDPETGEVTREFPDEASKARGTSVLAVSPSGDRILEMFFQSMDAQIYSAASGEPSTLLRLSEPEHGRPIIVRWSPNGKSLLAVTAKGQVRIIDSFDGTLVSAHTPKFPVNSAAWGPRSERIAIQDRRGSIQIYSVGNWKNAEVISNTTLPNIRKSIHWSSDGKWIAATGYNQSVEIYEVESKKRIRQFTQHRWAESFCIDPGSSYIAMSSGGAIFVFHLETGRLVDHLAGHRGKVYRMQWSSTGKRIFSLAASEIRSWDLRLDSFTQHKFARISASPNSHQLLARAGNLLCRVSFDGDAEAIREVASTTTRTGKPEWSPDGSQFAAGSIGILSNQTGEVIDDCYKGKNPFRVRWSPNAKHLAMGIDDTGRKMHIYNLADGETRHRETVFQDIGSDWIWSSDSSSLFLRTRSEFTHLSVRPDSSAERVLKVPASPTNHSSLAISPDDTLLACGVLDQIEIVDSTTLKPVGELTGHSTMVLELCWSPDGRRLASRDGVGQILLWDMETRTLVCPIYLPGGAGCQSMDWSYDGRYLLACDFDGVIHVLEGGEIAEADHVVATVRE